MYYAGVLSELAELICSRLQNISVRFEYLRDFLKSFPRLLEERTVIHKHTNNFSKLRTSILGITAKHRNIIFRNRTSSVYFTKSAKTYINDITWMIYRDLAVN